MDKGQDCSGQFSMRTLGVSEGPRFVAMLLEKFKRNLFVRLKLFALLALLAPMLVFAQQTQTKSTTYSPNFHAESTGPNSGKHYTSSDGQRVHALISASAALSGASARCGMERTASANTEAVRALIMGEWRPGLFTKNSGLGASSTSFQFSSSRQLR